MLSRPVIILTAALLLALGVAYWGLSERTRYIQLAKASSSQVTALEARLTETQAAVLAVQSKAATARQDTQEVLNANPAWSGAAVPGPVSDSLCSTIRCR